MGRSSFPDSTSHHGAASLDVTHAVRGQVGFFTVLITSPSEKRKISTLTFLKICRLYIDSRGGIE